MMPNRGILACCFAAILLVSTVTVTTAVVPALANESDAIMRILDAANAEANNELQKLQQKGVEIPQNAESLYSAALSEREAARQGFESGDAITARAHAVKALDLFKSLLDLLVAVDVDQERDDSSLIDAMDQDISNSQMRADKLKMLATANNVSISFSSYDSAINASADALSEGNLEEAKEQFNLAQELIGDIHEQIQKAVHANTGEKAREFALKTAQRLGRIVADLKEDGSPIPDGVRSAIIQRLESTIGQLENETDVERIIEVTKDSSELQKAIDQYNAYRVGNFDVQYIDMQEDIAALVASARALNIRIQSSEIDGLLGSIREKIQAGQEESAAYELDRLDSLLDEIEGVVEEFREVIEGIAEVRGKAMALRAEASNNARALEEIGRAVALLGNAESTLAQAAQAGVGSGTVRDVHMQLRLASSLTQEADGILTEVEDGLAEEKDRLPPEAGNNTMSGYRG